MPGLRFAGRALPHAAPPATETLRFGRAMVRLAPWRGAERVAHLMIAADAPLCRADVARCLDRLRAIGYRSVLTNAMSEPEREAFVALDFTVRAELQLLSLALDTEPTTSNRVQVDTVARHEHRDALAIDAVAFSPFWRLGPVGLRDALEATHTCQFRASRGAETGHDAAGREMTGYAITGKAATDGYLQRLAVDPGAQGRGYGRALVEDALHFLWHEGAERAYVNTQSDNERALMLYESCGFTVLPAGLAVMELSW